MKKILCVIVTIALFVACSNSKSEKKTAKLETKKAKLFLQDKISDTLLNQSFYCKSSKTTHLRITQPITMNSVESFAPMSEKQATDSLKELINLCESLREYSSDTIKFGTKDGIPITKYSKVMTIVVLPLTGENNFSVRITKTLQDKLFQVAIDSLVLTENMHITGFPAINWSAKYNVPTPHWNNGVFEENPKQCLQKINFLNECLRSKKLTSKA